MELVTAVIAVAVVVLIGRNDGSPLVAVAQQSARGRGRWAPVALILSLPLAPFFGLDAVAQSLQSLYGPGAAPALLLAVLATVALSVAVRVPTSITLALVGAMTGAALGNAPVDWPLVGRVLGLAACAPVVACLVARVVCVIPVELPTAASAARILRALRVVAFGAMALAYSANDGQKVLFVAALALGTTVNDVAPAWLAVGAVVFGVGVGAGMRGSGLALRGGVFAPLPPAAFWAQTSTALVVGLGSVLGVPLSMTQALTGSVIGVGLARGRRAVRWGAAVRIVVAWAWTLPVAGLLGFVLSHLPVP
jgi:PiT family inorganic phosphate transporter